MLNLLNHCKGAEEDEVLCSVKTELIFERATML